MKNHIRVRDDRNVNTQVRVPVIIEINVLIDFSSGRELHQPRATEYFVEARDDLPDIGASLQVRRLGHPAVEIVIVAAIPGNQGDSRITRHT